MRKLLIGAALGALTFGGLELWGPAKPLTNILPMTTGRLLVSTNQALASSATPDVTEPSMTPPGLLSPPTSTTSTQSQVFSATPPATIAESTLPPAVVQSAPLTASPTTIPSPPPVISNIPPPTTNSTSVTYADTVCIYTGLVPATDGHTGQTGTYPMTYTGSCAQAYSIQKQYGGTVTQH